MSPNFLDATDPLPRRITTTLPLPALPHLRQPYSIGTIHTMPAPFNINQAATKARSRPRQTPTSATPAPAAPTPSSARQASTRSASAKKTIDAQKEKKRILDKAATYTATKNAPPPPTPTPTSIPAPVATSTRQPPPQPHTPVQQPTPATPTTSKIIDEVRATGTLKPKPKQAPIDLPPAPATATYAHPRKPVASPAQPKYSNGSSRAPLAFARPAAPGRARAHQTQQQQRYRVVEPTPNSDVPSKYKPAMRRVTTIMVGIPIILVVGYELYNRARAEIRTKWDDGGKRV